MSRQPLQIRELAAWGYDSQPGRGALTLQQLEDAACVAQRELEARKPYQAESAVCAEESGIAANALAQRWPSIAGSGEFDGLAWKLAIVDLRKLIAFQRRIGFAHGDRLQVGQRAAWRQLLDLTLPMSYAQPSHALAAAPDGKSLTIRTLSPNLSFRFAPGVDGGLDSVRLVAHAGSPYFEVASYRGRWFLRDGYHRSFHLLKRGIFQVAAVVVRAGTLAELGATGHRFFAEDVLFSERPPMVTDFLDDRLVVRFLRPRPERVMQVSIQELREPASAGYREGEIP